MKSKSLAIRFLAALLLIMCCKANIRAQKDTLSVIELNTKAWNVKGKNLELSKKYAFQSIRIATRVNYKRGLSYSYNILGHYYKSKALYDSSLFYYSKSLEIREKLGDTLNIIRSYRNMAGIEKRLGNYKKAIELSWKALDLLKGRKNAPPLEKEKAWMEANMAAIYTSDGNYEEAFLLLRDAKNVFIKLEDNEGLAAASLNLGQIYEEQMLYSKALMEYTETVPIYEESDDQEELAKVYNNIGNIYYKIHQLKKAYSYYEKSLSIRRNNGFTDDLKGSLLNMGVIYDELRKPDSAAFYYRQALDLSITSKDTVTQYESYRNLGNLLYDRGDYKASLQHLLKAADLLHKRAQTVEDNSLFSELSKTYDALGNADSALFYSKQYSQMSDSLTEMWRKSVDQEVTIDKKDRELEQRDHKLELGVEKDKRQQTAIMGIAATLGLLLIIFFLYIRFVRSKKSMQELKEQVKDKELEALDAMLEGQQEERKRLATELHDTIGSMLSATKYSFKAMEKSMEKMLEENKTHYHKINSMLDETMDSVRRISHDMASGIFTEKGLEGALRELCNTFEQPGKMHVHLNVYGFDLPLEYNTEINLYRIVQELLTNIIRHANAGEITIQLIKSNANINLTVEDDGRGFDAEEARKKKGLGLSNIDLRVKKLSGQWNIDSGKGKGTTIIIDIPIIKIA